VLIAMGTSYVIVATTHQRARSEQLQKNSDLAGLIRQSVIEQKNIRSGRCTNAFALVDNAFNTQQAATRQGVPIVLRNLTGLGRDLRVHANQNDNNYQGFGYITDLSFTNARALGSASNYLRDDINSNQVRTNVYVGDIYLGLKKNATDLKDQRIYVGTMAINIDAQTSAFHSCTQFGGSEEGSICQSLGDNVEYDPILQRCLVRVGQKRLQQGACAAGERAIVNAFGEVECQAFITPVHCGYRQGTGEPQVMSVIYQSVPRCEGAPTPQQHQGQPFNRGCGRSEVIVEGFAQCYTAMGLNQQAFDFCIQKFPNAFTVIGLCMPSSNTESAQPAPLATNGSEIAPSPGSCRCGDQIINSGQRCVLCSPIGTYSTADSFPWLWYNFGYTRYNYQCNQNGALSFLSTVTDDEPCSAPVVVQ
jgi:hypothetical protein